MSNPPELITLPNGTQVTEQQYAMVTMAMIGLAERATQGNSDAFGALIDVFFRAESHQLALTPMSQKTLEELTVM